MPNNKPEVLIIGLDGVDPELLDRYIQQGILPNLKRLRDKGVYARLKSSIPIITTVTWTSFITGKNPGKHGIFGFVNYKDDTHNLKILNSSDRKTEGIWSILNRCGKTVGIFNLPSLYPAEKIDKFMVCGMLTPNKGTRFVYPYALQAEFLKEINDYEIDVGVVKAAYDSKDILLKNMYFLTDKRFEATEYFLKNYPCDLFITVITETDRMQHYFLDDESALAGYFKHLDEKIGRLLGLVDEKTNILVLSDHGMGRFKKFLYVNKWLIDKGYLNINKASTNYVKHSLFKKTVQLVSTVLVKMRFDVEKIRKILPAWLVHKFTYLYCYFGGIDWKNSAAYFCSGVGEGVVINTSGRFKDATVTDRDYESVRAVIIDGLLKITDPDTGEPVIDKAFRREDIFSGDHVNTAPDIVLKLKDGYATNETVSAAAVLGLKPDDEMLVAEHRLEGIFIGSGKDIKAGVSISGISILDIAPTAFTLMGVTVPADFDGRILNEIFREGAALPRSSIINEGIRIKLKDRIKNLKSTGRIK